MIHKPVGDPMFDYIVEKRVEGKSTNIQIDLIQPFKEYVTFPLFIFMLK